MRAYVIIPSDEFLFGGKGVTVQTVEVVELL
jgi:hypothetical protein